MEPSRFAAAVGRTSHPVSYLVEAGHVRRFADAIGDPSPIYRELAAAQAAGHPRIPAPPTFATALRSLDPREGLDIDWTKLLHGEQEFSYQRPLYCGDRVSVIGRISEAYVKEGKAGPMDMMVIETQATDEQGAPVYSARALIVIRR